MFHRGIYLPETERQSHCFKTQLAGQLDEYTWFDSTRDGCQDYSNTQGANRDEHNILLQTPQHHIQKTLSRFCIGTAEMLE
jgi:hypothetical protein